MVLTQTRSWQNVFKTKRLNAHKATNHPNLQDLQLLLVQLLTTMTHS